MVEGWEDSCVDKATGVKVNFEVFGGSGDNVLKLVLMIAQL